MTCTCTARPDIAETAAHLGTGPLADRVRAALTDCTINGDVILYGDGELAVDPATGEVWEGEWVRSADQQLHLALMHLAAALAAGAEL